MKRVTFDLRSSGVGELMTPARFLAPGDIVRVEIERIGHIENRVIDEPDDTVHL